MHISGALVAVDHESGERRELSLAAARAPSLPRQQARVLRHLTEGAHQGIVFRLDEKNEGVLWRDQMSIMEWDNKDMLMAVNSAHDVEVTSSTYNKARKSWRIKVKTI